jgi:hypothetical protein
LPFMTVLPAPIGAGTVVGDGACIEEARMVAVDFPGAKIWDRYRQEVVADRDAAQDHASRQHSPRQSPTAQEARDRPRRS